MSDILSFRGENRFLSNFYLVDLVYNDKLYRSSEHLYQSLKMKNPEDAEIVRLAYSPGRAKALGGSLLAIDGLEERKYGIMCAVVKIKFYKSAALRERLLKTGDVYLEEGNTWHDNYFGACSCPKCANKPKLNNLGKILMMVRREIRSYKENDHAIYI